MTPTSDAPKGHKLKVPRCQVCGGKGWQWYRRRSPVGLPSRSAWGRCSACHGFGVSLAALAERLGFSRKQQPSLPGEPER